MVSNPLCTSFPLKYGPGDPGVEGLACEMASKKLSTVPLGLILLRNAIAGNNSVIFARSVVF